MRMRTKVLGIAAAVVGLVGQGGSVAHRAAAQELPLPSVSDIVVFSACTQFLTPVPLIGPSNPSPGTYVFNTNNPCLPPFNTVPGFCFGSSDLDGEDIPGNVLAELIGNCTIQANGTYVSTLCGTGITGGSPVAPTDTATVWADDPPFTNNTAGQAYAGITYSIIFVAGQGILIGTATEVDSQPAVIRAVGVVNILPTGGSCVTGVTQFRATGVAALIESPV